jgi:hypothetical protein
LTHRDAVGWEPSTASRVGTWLADAVSISMVVFGLTGAFMWWTQRGRRLLRGYRRAS